MKNPVHPGRIVQQDCLEPLHLTIAQAAAALGVARQTLSRLINGRARVSNDMATRLAITFGSTRETWLRMQAAHDLAAADHRRNPD